MLNTIIDNIGLLTLAGLVSGWIYALARFESEDVFDKFSDFVVWPVLLTFGMLSVLTIIGLLIDLVI